MEEFDSEEESVNEISDSEGESIEAESNSTPNSNSGRLTARQKRLKGEVLDEVNDDSDILNYRQSKKVKRTAEEEEARKSELSRRRKNDAVRRAEEAKQMVIRKLLKRNNSFGVGRRRNKDSEEGVEREAGEERGRVYVQRRDQSFYVLAEGEDITVGNKREYPVARGQCSLCDKDSKYSKGDKAACGLDHWRLL